MSLKEPKFRGPYSVMYFFLKNDALAKPSSTVAKVIRKQIIANFRLRKTFFMVQQPSVN